MAWSGEWTEDKLDVFEKYVAAYLNVMKYNRDRYGWQLIYFDAFAGSGSNGCEADTSCYLFDKEEASVYKGAAERVLSIDGRGFDKYYFVDKDVGAIKALEERLISFRANKRFKSGDANKHIAGFARLMRCNKSKCRLLVLIDPFGMQVDWATVEQMRQTGIDLWILIPSGVIINRLLNNNGELIYIKKLESFFGMTEQEIRQSFYATKQKKNLFNEETIVEKIPNAINKITEIYLARLKTVFKYTINEPLAMYNSRNVPIYHFAFASNNDTGVKIASQIVSRKQDRN
ncbi:hypothetical protein AGMMS50229_09720 [Campylobacterota bacterium]|nr:hypothetical protein AGMMS50229_09720 [Campylobacterota bacterium]